MSFNTPILFLIWNRHEPTKEVFEKIRALKPKKLYIAADGPRKNNYKDKINCVKTRKITEKINWECEVRRLYRKENLGLKKSVSDAINWFFDNNNEGIILEDDCLPDKSFFYFCRLMLKRYRNNAKIMHISGDNFQLQSTWNKESYYFSIYPHIWGWATWRRAWKKYDLSMGDWKRFKNSQAFKRIFPNFWNRFHWSTTLDAVYAEKINTWDFQWIYSIWKNNGLSVVPGTNLVSNIGFGKDAVHTVSTDSVLSRIETTPISKNLKRKTIDVNSQFDAYSSRHVFNIRPLRDVARAIYYKIIL